MFVTGFCIMFMVVHEIFSHFGSHSGSNDKKGSQVKTSDLDFSQPPSGESNYVNLDMHNKLETKYMRESMLSEHSVLHRVQRNLKDPKSDRDSSRQLSIHSSTLDSLKLSSPHTDQNSGITVESSRTHNGHDRKPADDFSIDNDEIGAGQRPNEWTIRGTVGSEPGVVWRTAGGQTLTLAGTFGARV